MPEQSHITVRCPECRVVLRIKTAPRPDQTITCPKCGRRYPFSEYVPVRLVKRADARQSATTRPQSDDTVLPPRRPAPRPAVIVFAGVSYKLRPGRNVVGRWATTSTADIQLPDSSRFMSREHFLIEVSQAPDGFRYTISPVKDVFQPTSVDGRPLIAGQSLPLRHRSSILITPAGAEPLEISLIDPIAN